MQATEDSDRREFIDAARVHGSILFAVELKCLLWLAKRMPTWVSPGHLTVVGLFASIGMGVSYYLARLDDRRALLAIPALLTLGWFGDSLDGTVARVRNCVRPRYGGPCSIEPNEFWNSRRSPDCFPTAICRSVYRHAYFGYFQDGSLAN